MNHEQDAIDILRHLPFVRDVQSLSTLQQPGTRHDAELAIQTPTGLFRFLIEVKRSYLTRSSLNQLLAWIQDLRSNYRDGVILIARHIPRPTAERLIEARVNFVDDAGNVHLEMGDRYNWTVVGKPALEPVSKRRPISAAEVQLLFQFATHPESVNWPVRKLEPAAGVSKSKIAQARRQLIEEQVLRNKGKLYELAKTRDLHERLASGYIQVLRPKLLLGRFRPIEKTADSFLARLRTTQPLNVRYAVTGGAAADLLQHYYHAPDTSIFVNDSTRKVTHELRVLPDVNGPVTILRAFGDVVFWEKREEQVLAPPGLIYAELLASDDPRAHEAANELRKTFLE